MTEAYEADPIEERAKDIMRIYINLTESRFLNSSHFRKVGDFGASFGTSANTLRIIRRRMGMPETGLVIVETDEEVVNFGIKNGLLLPKVDMIVPSHIDMESYLDLHLETNQESFSMISVLGTVGGWIKEPLDFYKNAMEGLEHEGALIMSGPSMLEDFTIYRNNFGGQIFKGPGWYDQHVYCNIKR